jgi:hypothetical protein
VAQFPDTSSAAFQLSPRKRSRLKLRRKTIWMTPIALAACLTTGLTLLGGCHSQRQTMKPTIEFTKIPPAAQGGRERVDTISGRVVGAQPGQRIVVYARSGPWWVQPWPDQPFLPIQADSSWSTSTHLGFEYAALLVNDQSGALHIRMKKKGDRWACAEVVLGRSLGYGTYIMTVRDSSHLEPAAVLSMNTFDQWGGEQNYRELDVEISRWGDATNKNNAQYGVQPFYIPGNVAPFIAPPGTLTHSFHWEPGRVTFRTVRGNSAHTNAPVVSEHVFTSGVPSPGQERLLLGLYDIASDKYPLQKDSEIVIEKFEYLP